MAAKGKKKEPKLHPEIRKHIWIVLCVATALLFILSAVGEAGSVGRFIYEKFSVLFGWGYYALPITLLVLAIAFAGSERVFVGTTLVGAAFFVLSVLGLLDIVSPAQSRFGGYVGEVIGVLQGPFGKPAAIVLVGAFMVISGLVTVNRPLGIMTAVKRWADEQREGKRRARETESVVISSIAETLSLIHI